MRYGSHRVWEAFGHGLACAQERLPRDATQQILTAERAQRQWNGFVPVFLGEIRSGKWTIHSRRLVCSAERVKGGEPKVEQHGWLVGWLVGWLAGWLAGWLVGWSVGWLVGWVVGWFVGWLVGWWFGCLFVCLFGWLVVW